MPKTQKAHKIDSERLIYESIKKVLKHTYAPISTYRLQFNQNFSFSKARTVVSYLNELGIHAVYASPYFQACPGSMHGYDVADFTRLNEEIGKDTDYENFCRTLKKYHMTQILDLVPNHMGIASHANRLWVDVLENGERSHYASFFDINWMPAKKELHGKVLLPILGDQYGRVLENKEIRLAYEDGQFRIYYWSRMLPVAAETYADILRSSSEVLKKNKQHEREYFDVVRAFETLKYQEQNIVQFDSNYDLARKKAIAKERLAALYERSIFIRQHIAARLVQLNGVKGKPRTFDDLDRILNLQFYRLAYWRVASHEINYRRFFDVNELAAIRVEDGDVFNYYHQFLFQLIGQGCVKGLRVDHPDGLYNPPVYFSKLQRAFMRQAVLEVLRQKGIRLTASIRERLRRILRKNEFKNVKPFYLVAEKILDRKESLPADWNVHGTVGYDYLNDLNGLFIQRENEPFFNEFYEKFSEKTVDFHELVYEKKKYFAAFYMTSELNTLGYRLQQICQNDRRYRDFTLNDITTALREVIACFPVYRTYISPQTVTVSVRDARYIHIAIEKAKTKHPAISHTLFEYLREILLLKNFNPSHPASGRLYRDFILKFQQLTAPIMAKGLEDTVFYIYNRFISLNEVGGDPLHFGCSSGEFHKNNIERRKFWPYTMISTSTHDTKRSEDVRMRLNVLSEMPVLWRSAVRRWTRLNFKYKTLIGQHFFPDKNTEYFIYQTLLGVWPDGPLSKQGYQDFKERLWGALNKSIREAKVYTNWLNPNQEYEDAVKKFLFSILERTAQNLFLRNFYPFQQKISVFGKYNSLSALVLKLCSPGVPDTYQGTEIWDYSLVDPDNRRLVDYDHRKRLLEDIRTGIQRTKSLCGSIREFLKNKDDGRIKMFLLWRALHFRKLYHKLFVNGDYIPLEVRGERAHSIVAFLRKKAGKYMLTASVRFIYSLAGDVHSWPPPAGRWKDTRIRLPKDLSGTVLKNIFTEEKIRIYSRDKQPCLYAGDLFKHLNTAILLNFEFSHLLSL
ncbi:MAG: malto-oligosyltrehalose synthase [Candidatus Omnitrophica bacterium]|nr:malto-oligosyltrehalose synthase [Candidatus Omnitrophota bacterium]